MSAWTEHVARWRDCELCPLHAQRGNIVIARGQVPCDVLFVGEAPGASEDAIGQPFVGPAGQLLDSIIERALPAGTRFALTNLVCCYPRDAKAAGDNEPESAEILACRPRLSEFIHKVALPKLIVCVGRLASEYVHHTTITCADIDHPAYILRMPLAQKQMAVHRCVVVLRNAVEGVLQ